MDLSAGTGSGETAPDLTEFDDKNSIKAVQQALNNKCYDCGTPDGLAGKNTASAITAYQNDHGLTATGTVTGELLDSLGLR